MPIFEWTTELDIGVDAMNEEHKRLIAFMNKVYDLREAQAEVLSVKAALDDFVAYTQKHFADEEAFMQSIEYPGLDEHKAKHRKLFEDLSNFIEVFNRTGDIDDSFFAFLKMWLRGHIVYIDGKYHQFIEERHLQVN